MGNKPCKLVLRIDDHPIMGTKHDYVAGEEISGRIMFHVSQRTDLRSLRGINLIFHGQEYIEMKGAGGSGGGERGVSPLLGQDNEIKTTHGNKLNNRHRATETLVRLENRIATFTEPLRAGQYEFPFRWQIPGNLPSSMVCRQESSSNSSSSSLSKAPSRPLSLAEIRYTVMANLVICGRAIRCDETLSSSILSIQSKLSELTNEQLFVEQITYPIPSFSCFGNGARNRGCINLGYAANSDTVSPNSILSVQVFGYNQSRRNVKRLLVRLVETIAIHSCLQWKEIISRTLAQTDLDVLSCSWWQKRTPYRPEGYPSQTLELRIPTGGLDSYSGNLIHVRHVLIVTAETGKGFFASTASPEVTKPIRLVHAYIDAATTQTSTTDACTVPFIWQPIIADCVTLPQATAVLIEDESTSARLVTPTYPLDSDLLDTQPASVMPTAPQEPSITDRTDLLIPHFPTLVELQQVAMNCPENLNVIVQDIEWRALVQSLSPDEFALIVCCSRNHSNPIVAAMTLATTMNQHMTTRHMLAGLNTILDPMERIHFIRQVAPLVKDLQSNRTLLHQEIPSFEEIYNDRNTSDYF